MTRSKNNIRTNWESVKNAVSAKDFRRQLPTPEDKETFDQVLREIRTQEIAIRTKAIADMWDGVKNAIPAAIFKQGLGTLIDKQIFDSIVRGKVPRANNSAKVVNLGVAKVEVPVPVPAPAPVVAKEDKIGKLRALMSGFKGTLKNKEKYVADLPKENEQTLFTFLASSPKFSGRAKTLFKRVQAKPAYRAPLYEPPPTPPGYEYVPTKGDGNCMFYAVYYAWNPEEGPARAQEAESAQALRQMLAAEADANDINIMEVQQNVQTSVGLSSGTAEVRSLSDLLNRINAIVASNTKTDQQKREEILPLYKQAVLNKAYWGTSRELEILNRFGQMNGKPFVWVFSGPTQELLNLAASTGVYIASGSQRLDPATHVFVPFAHPIHYNGYNHYSILRAIDTPEGVQARANANAIAAAELEPSEEEVVRERIYRKRAELQSAIETYLEGKGKNATARRGISLNITNRYSGLPSLNDVVTAARERIRAEGMTAGEAAEVEALVRAKIQELQGGKRKTRKQRKGMKKRFTRKH